LRPTLRWIKTVAVGLAIILATQVTVGLSQAVIGEPLDNFLIPSEARFAGEIQLTSGTVQFWDPGSRIFATMGRYDQLGTWLAVMMLIMIAVLYEPKLKQYHAATLGLFIISVPALVLTFSRSSWFGFLLGFLFISIFAKRDRRVMIGVGLTLLTIVGYLIFSGLVVSRLVEGADQTVVERFFEAFSYARWQGEYYGLGRLFWIVQTILTVVPASPLFGFGPAMYGGGAAAALGSTAVYDQLGLPFGVYGTEGYIDNNWFSLWGELGTIGLVLYLWVYLGIFRFCVQVWRRSKKIITRTIALGAASIFVAVALNAFLATFLEVRTLAVYLWVFAALVYVRAEQEKLQEET
jgi:O-antigen ligase